MRNQMGSEPMCESHVTMTLVPQRSTPRWKEWLPLISQQQRLRNLVQVMAYNVPSDRGTKVYYTLHITSMSAPFYTSEKLHHPNPKWVEVEPCILANNVDTSATGMVVRLWQCKDGEDQDTVLLVWGLYMSGLTYLGPSLSRRGALFRDCAIVLHMFGGFFTASQWLHQPISRSHLRFTQFLIPAQDVRPSYNVQRLLRLRIFQQNIKKQNMKAEELRKRIIAKGFGFVGGQEQLYPHETNPAVRKILNRTRPKSQPKADTLPIRRQLEIARCRVNLLQNEKARKTHEVQNLQLSVEKATENNALTSIELQERYHELHRCLADLRDRQRRCAEMREQLTTILRQLAVRRRELMSQLSDIYPIDQQSDGKYTIRGVHLPNSEDLGGSDDIQVAVALGFVTHVVQMLSIFLQVPLRYPMINFGSRSKIVDNISEKIADRDREFPLFSRTKDKQHFHYGVFLLNKNIAQLRWLCSLRTHDLRPTLMNLSALLRLNTLLKGLDSQKRSLSGSSLDMMSISANASPVGSLVIPGSQLPTAGLGLRISSSSSYQSAKSVGSAEHLYPQKNGTALRINQSNNCPDGVGNGTNLSYSLDKGLDEFGEIQKAEESKKAKSGLATLTVPAKNLAHVGSEPILSACTWTKDEAADDDQFDRDSRTTIKSNDKSEFELVTERIVQLVVDSQSVPPEKESRQRSCSDSGTGSRTEERNFHPADSGRERSCSESRETSETRQRSCSTSGDAESRPILCSGDGTARREEERVFHPAHSGERSCSASGDDAAAHSTASQPSVPPQSVRPVSSSSSSSEPERCRERSCSDSEQEQAVGNGKWAQSEVRPGLSNEQVKCNETVADSVFANVTSRTEVLASHSTSFNLVAARHNNSS